MQQKATRRASKLSFISYQQFTSQNPKFFFCLCPLMLMCNLQRMQYVTNAQGTAFLVVFIVT